MSALKNKQLKYFKMAKLVKEGKVVLTKKDLKLFVESLKHLVDPRLDLRTQFTSAGNSGASPIEPMYLENHDDVKFDTTPCTLR